ncbi:hypothetical protein D3C74_403040 [compost metagenome]
MDCDSQVAIGIDCIQQALKGDDTYDEYVGGQDNDFLFGESAMCVQDNALLSYEL